MISVAALCPLLFGSPSHPVLHTPALPAPASRRTARTLAAGVELIQVNIPEGAPGGPLTVSLLRIDPKAPGVRIEAALGQDRVWNTDPNLGREAVSRLAKRRGALAAVNAGFFPYAGNPIGLHVEGGDLVTEPTRNRTSFLIDRDGASAVGAYGFTGRIQADGDTVPVHGLNRKPGKGNEMLVFTPRFGATTLPAASRWEIVLEGAEMPVRPGGTVRGTVRAVREGGGAPIDKDTVVVSGGGASAEWLKSHAPVGARVEIALKLAPLGDTKLDPAKILHAVTGAPRIVANGKPDIRIDAEGVQPSFSTTRHPRTAAGVTRDGRILLMTVDGRQKALSRGATLAELAGLLVGYGAVDAVNLDGGGSTTLVVDGAILNAPSDGPERPVADALLVFAEPPTDRVTEPPSLAGPDRPLTVGETFAFALPEGIAAADAVWGMGSAGPGFIDQNGVFRALRAGKSTVTLRVAGQTARVPVEVVAAPTEAPKPPR